MLGKAKAIHYALGGKNRVDERRRREELFRAIREDNDVHVEQVLRHRHGIVHEFLFSVEYKEHQKNEPKLIQYGTCDSDSRRGHLKEGASILHVAVWLNALKVVKVLIPFGARPNKRDGINLSALDLAKTEEMRAALHGPELRLKPRVDAATQLVLHLGGTNAKEEFAKREELFSAIVKDKVRVVQRMVPSKSELLRSMLFGVKFNQTSSSSSSHRKVFVSYGVYERDSPRGRIRDGASLLHVAVWAEALSTVKYLMDLGAKPNRKDALGLTPIELATTEELERALNKPAGPPKLRVDPFYHLELFLGGQDQADELRRRERLFQAINQDDVITVERAMRSRDGLVHEFLFGLKFKEKKQYRQLVSYGVVEENYCCGFIKLAATALHVAVWARALRVTKMLIDLGASTGVRDKLGVTPFDLAEMDEIRSLLKRPPAVSELLVERYRNGSAVLRWKMSRCKPRVDLFEIREETQKASWLVDPLRDAKILPVDNSKDGPMVYVHQTPAVTVLSATMHVFSVRARNVDGYWSDWCNQDGKLKSNHWAKDWYEEYIESKFQDDSSLEEKRATEESKISGLKTREEEKSVLLVLGKVSFGYVRMKDWFRRAQMEQARAAICIQSAFRTVRQQRIFREQISIRRITAERERAANKIQEFFRTYLSRTGWVPGSSRRPAASSFATESKGSHHRHSHHSHSHIHSKHKHSRRYKPSRFEHTTPCTFTPDRESRVERELAKLRAMKAHGYPV